MNFEWLYVCTEHFIWIVYSASLKKGNQDSILYLSKSKIKNDIVISEL